ncbi:MFS transporter [Pseudomonas capeferrum]|uniref:MFS transporter n=1 Tax=Pseudomonas capeferrum TaxID=1495066 RepID=UPI0015E451C9|nr:MFS transporter [Pseudomonas capeferrum]MBA1200399.1 MFS transporter [Pseudomonas capeferrum]
MTSRWSSIVLIYLFGLAATSALGMMGPLADDIGRAFAVSGSVVGIAIAGQLLPLAFAGIPMGWLIDRIGPRPLLGVGVLCLAACSLANGLLGSFGLLRLSLLMEGIALVAVLTAGQVMLMVTTEGRRQVQALTLWSTVMPVGYALGLLLVSPFAGGAGWQTGFLLHAGVLVVLALTVPLLPDVRLRVGAGSGFGVLRNVRVLRFGLGLSMSALAGIGTSAVGALYLSQAHGIELARSAQMMALASVSGVAGSLLVGLLLTRGWPGLPIGVLVVVIALTGGVAFYVPWGWLAVAWGGAILQQLAVGGFIALTYALLPRALPDPGMAGTAAGMVGQITGIGATLSAPVFFAALAYGQWSYFLVILLIAWGGSLLLLPVWSRAAPAGSQPARCP